MSKTLHPAKLHLGSLSGRSTGTHAPLQRVDFGIPQRVTNSASTKPYVPSAWPVRTGADDHKHFKSRGF